VLTDLNGVEKYKDEKYKSISLEMKMEIEEIEKENLGLKEIKITEGDISAGDQFRPLQWIGDLVQIVQ
jgi:hypothetical protein